MLDLFTLEPEKVYGMAANTVGKEEKINARIDSDMYVASTKKDGNYARFVRQNNEIKMQTRGISVVTKTYGEIQDKVPHLIEYLKKVVPEKSMIIGELYRPGWIDKNVGSILRCLPPKAILRQKDNPLIFFIHDVWFYDGEDFMTQTKLARIEKLKKIQEEWIHNEGMIAEIEFAEYVEGPDNIKKLIAEVFDNNEEGVVLTLKDSIVNPGARTAWKTLKIKQELQNDADVFLTGNFKPSTKEYTGKDIFNWEYWINDKTSEKLFGKHYQDYIEGATITPITKNYYKGWPGSLEMGVIKKDTGERVSIGYISGVSDELKVDFSTNPEKYKDKVCVVTAMQTTADFKLRHSKFKHFRDDINIEDCTFEKIFG